MKDNPFLEFWKESQEDFYKKQADWMSTWLNSDDPVTDDFLNKSKKSWAVCEEQYRSWMQTMENWLSPGVAPAQDQDDASLMLKFMLDPSNFSRFSFDQMNSFFRKMIDGPELADIGIIEKRFLKSGQDWLALCNASEAYQSVIAEAWKRAFKLYADEFSDIASGDMPDTKVLLDRWLEIADAEMVNTLRSSDFLEAQRNFFKAGTNYKLKQQEFMELWFESQSIPTRTEIDEIHQTVHEMKREIRMLRQQMQKSSSPTNSTQAKPVKARPVKTTPAKRAPKSRPTPASSNKAKVKPKAKSKQIEKKQA